MRTVLGVVITLLIVVASGCGDDDDGERVYEPCEVADDCRVAEGQTAACLGTGSGSFCAIECNTDDDCIDDDWDWVCSPFESNPGRHCFPSCEDAPENVDAGWCPPGYECRSTGGGPNNRRICFPTF